MATMNYDDLAADYAEHRQAMPDAVRTLIEGARVTADSRVLELGCGTGNHIIALDELIGCWAWGIDRSPEMLDRARERGSGVRFGIGDATGLGFADVSFDLVFSVDVIHHVAARRDFFAEAYRVLAPGGKLCTLTHSEDMIRHSMIMARYFPETVAVNLARYPKISELRGWMTEVGFRDISEQTIRVSYRIEDLDCYAAKANSTLHLIADNAFAQGLARLERDLAQGPVTGERRQLALWGST